MTLFFFTSQAWPQNTPADGQDCEKLKKDYETLLSDYNNVLAQAKALIPYKNKVQEMEDAARQFGIEKEKVAKDKEESSGEAALLKEKILKLDEDVVRLTQERDDYKKSFEKASVGNIIGDETKKKISDLEKEKASSRATIKDMGSRMRSLEGLSLKNQAEAEFTKRQLEEVKAQYADAKKQNRGLERKLEDLPKNFAELARENKILVKRTALMHYNLGVFYTQNREFQRALAEFEKAVELSPEDSASHFNLGYIYAEHLQNRPKAVEHFKQFLKLAKRDDKDADWVKRYILTWQTWEGNVPIK
jgi:tetratricopeptide (TPR) repeat protein